VVCLEFHSVQYGARTNPGSMTEIATKILHTHTHTHTHIYIYIYTYIYIWQLLHTLCVLVRFIVGISLIPCVLQAHENADITHT